MTIAIITQPLRYNYGGILQNFALQTVLKRMGHEVITLDAPLLPKYSVLAWIGRILHRLLLKARGVKVSVFSEIQLARQNKYICKNTSKFINSYISKTEFNHKTRTHYDALIVGSDQVWRPAYNKNNLYDQFFQFAKDWKDVRRLAYAASFGVDYWEFTEEQTEVCRSLAQLFDGVSVRETSGISLCKTHLNVDAVCVLDPTLLLDMKDYVDICEIEKYPQSKGNMLCYILNDDEKTVSIKKGISQEVGLDYFDTNVFSFSQKKLQVQRPVEEWLRGFYDAEFVLADSFHACAFSIIFNKPFAVLANAQRGNTRLTHILSLINQEYRLISGFSDFMEKKPLLVKAPNAYDSLQTLRSDSLNFLYTHLK